LHTCHIKTPQRDFSNAGLTATKLRLQLTGGRLESLNAVAQPEIIQGGWQQTTRCWFSMGGLDKARLA